MLPYRHDDKLLFPLCARLCGRRNGQKTLLDRDPIGLPCTLTEQRALTSTWCSPELVKAVELGVPSQIHLRSLAF